MKQLDSETIESTRILYHVVHVLLSQMRPSHVARNTNGLTQLIVIRGLPACDLTLPAEYEKLELTRSDHSMVMFCAV
jgi:hypothetical protein